MAPWSAVASARRRDALDEFVSESTLQRVGAADARASRVDPLPKVEPLEVCLEPIEVIWKQATNVPTTPEPSAKVQFWPMLAAALVAFGVSLLAVATITKYAHF